MLWVKAFHIIALICWFAGLFYLPRLFVYHAMSEDETSRERFKVMERKLYRGIMTPAMLATIALGLWLLFANWSYFATQGWMQLKLVLVAVLIGYHMMCGTILKRFRDDTNTQGHVFYRWFNEFPVLILVAVIILVIVRPF